MNEPGTGRPIVKHTPGPWHAWNDDVWGWGVGSEDYTICEELSEANARLIAAAPELLEALEALRLQALQSNVNVPANEWGREALGMANAAIAKATGTAGERHG